MAQGNQGLSPLSGTNTKPHVLAMGTIIMPTASNHVSHWHTVVHIAAAAAAAAGAGRIYQRNPAAGRTHQQADPKHDDFQWSRLSPLIVENGITRKNAINTIKG